MFQEWEKELDRLPEDSKDNAEGRQKLGIYKQCRGYMKPLLRLLKYREVSKEIMNKLFEVMIFCLDKDYIRAHDKYIELAIGNAPWPMGVTMVGIHERSGRSRIYTSQVAHILNDENTKKYLQSVKRIMSLVQRIYPASPSNCVVS
jgi:pre-mRNA-splicing factor 18